METIPPVDIDESGSGDVRGMVAAEDTALMSSTGDLACCCCLFSGLSHSRSASPEV